MDDKNELDYNEIFFINNKVRFKTENLSQKIFGMSYIKNDIYWVVVNSFHADLRNQLIDMLIDIISKYYYEDTKFRVYLLKSK